MNSGGPWLNRAVLHAGGVLPNIHSVLLPKKSKGAKESESA
jgi:hypothetical protein